MLAFHNIIGFPQDFEWAKTFKSLNGSISSYDPYSGSMAIDVKGNIYTVGSFSGSLHLDSGSNTYSLDSDSTYLDIFISKLDDSGNLIWAKRLGGTFNDWGRSIVLDSYGNIYVTGFFSLETDFDQGGGVYN